MSGADSSPRATPGRSRKRRRAYDSTEHSAESLWQSESQSASIDVIEEEISITETRRDRVLSYSTIERDGSAIHPYEIEDDWTTREVISTVQEDASVNDEEQPGPRDVGLTGEDTETEITPKDTNSKAEKRIRDNVLTEWNTYYCEEYLLELIRHESPVAVESKKGCLFCGKFATYESPTKEADQDEYVPVKCDDCVGLLPRCAKCIIKEHKHNPLHRVKHFKNHYWSKTTLKSLGAVLNLTHDGRECPEPSIPVDITVIDTTGIQVVAVAFCGCVESYKADQAHKNQLLRHQWYPATSKMPRTVATFRVLKQFHTMTLQSKISAYDYYQSLVRLTDHTGTQAPPKRYDEFLRVVREYRHLLMLKRRGRGCVKENISETRRGELALKCPACPHEGINIPTDWKTKVNSWIYTLYVMMDANFKLKSKKRASKDDVELGPGWSYFVEDKEYTEHLRMNENEKEIRYCDAGLKAVDYAFAKGSKAYDVSGVIAIQCRHMFVFGNGVGDTQLGERFINADFILLSALKGRNIQNLVISYDIACQYQPNFAKRVEKYPAEMQLDLDKVKVTHMIPMFHLPGHGDKCHARYSPYTIEHIGRTDGENIERGWANMNPVSLSTREMTKASRHDSVNDHIGIFNWERLISMGRIEKERLEDAKHNYAVHLKAHNEFSGAFPPDVIEKTEKEIAEWNKDPWKRKNPYQLVNKKTTTLKELKAILLERKRKEKRAEEGANDDLDETMNNTIPNPIKWLSIGLELEDALEALRETFVKLNDSSTAAQKTLANEKNMLLFLRVRAWKEVQRHYMPGLPVLDTELMDLSDSNTGGEIPLVYKIPLRMPSELEKSLRERICTLELLEIEEELRKALAEDALDDARRLLRKGFTLVNKKKQHVDGQGQRTKTRMEVAMDGLREAKLEIVETYAKARKALLKLNPEGEWKERLKPLDMEHMTPPSMEVGGTGNGHYITSWIWTMEGVAIMHSGENSNSQQDAANTETEAPAVDEGLLVEWARSHARLQRWKEEIILVKEEMRRVIVYLHFLAKQWIEQGEMFVEIGQQNVSDVNRGRIAYANRQASVYYAIADSFAMEWKGELEFDVGDPSQEKLNYISVSF